MARFGRRVRNRRGDVGLSFVTSGEKKHLQDIERYFNIVIVEMPLDVRIR